MSKRRTGNTFRILVLAVLLLLCSACQHPSISAAEIADREITEAIRMDLLVNELVSAHLIDVVTKDGVVELSGPVDNMLAKEIAIRLAQSTKGVRSVIDEMEVRPVETSDSDIEKDLEFALLLDKVVDLDEVNVSAEEGAVTLSGTVSSWAEKEFAHQTAKRIRGVKSVKNDIRVKYKSDRPDNEIKPEIRRRIDSDPFVGGELIDIEVRDGKVKLNGFVGSPVERSYARGDALVSGVSSVDVSGLKVEPWAEHRMRRERRWVHRSNEEIEKSVEDALRYDPRVLSTHVSVRVDNGTVILDGAVEDLEAQRAAGKDARNTMGVWRVQDNLRVRTLDHPLDLEIAENIRRSLLIDPVTERYDLSVVVRNQKVFLYGSVGSYFEKERAEEVAARTPGVADIENNLVVQTGWPFTSDETIEKNIENQFFWSFFVDSDDISVEVKEGVAILTGDVGSWQELDAAVINAFEGGARDVLSRLRIEGVEEPLPEHYYHHSYYWVY
jgi:osmotically-inducible protein OsmY